MSFCFLLVIGKLGVFNTRDLDKENLFTNIFVELSSKLHLETD